MNTVKLSTKGQIVIPKEIRKAVHLVAGMELTVVLIGDEIRIRPTSALPRISVEEAAGCLHRPRRKLVEEEEVQQAIGELLKAQDDATRK